ncbi:hypothetical protein [Amycolatopsis thermophila]|uniref:Uncharacterized protein n=1 Tax=Amycolatopsis thermophila TaxID=206084 RepID=A0ABU0EM48_9PSEU|nr:hypothetical protein [Amycolatopsis thermophila]MDQ0376346.1 hypothetical protein [Amycolatopsis thermophila]
MVQVALSCRLTQMQDRMREVGRRLYRLQQAPILGNEEYRPFLTAMDSDDQSLVRVFLAAQEMLVSLHEAIEIAISKYDASDAAASEALHTFKDQDAR